MEETKAFWQSKSFWLNAGTFLALALMLPELGDLIPDSAAKYVGGGNALLNLALRFFGNQAQPLSLNGAPKFRAFWIVAILAPTLVFGSACALKGSARHRAVVADTTIHSGLAAVQDAEMAMYQAGVPEVVAHHRAFNEQLVPALETGDAINRTIRDWPVDKPAPADLPILASRLQGLTRTVAGNFPDGAAKSKLLDRLFAVSDVVLNLLLTLPPSAGAGPMLPLPAPSSR